MDAPAWIEAVNLTFAIISAIFGCVIWLCVKVTQWHQRLEELERRMAEHEKACSARDEAVQKRLEWGKTQLTKLESEQVHIAKAVDRIEKMLRRDP